MNYAQTLAPDGNPIKVVQLSHDCGTRLDIMDFGATWLSCKVPVKNGDPREVILGCDSLEGFLKQQAYLGATVGRYANRIAHARIERDGKTYQLDANQQGKHQLHGGAAGFSHRRWRILDQASDQVTFGLDSADGDQGFPGNLAVKVSYRLLPDCVIRMECEAVTDHVTPVALTNHSYFNLDGGKTDARQHALSLQADFYTPVDTDLIPLGALAAVEGTGFDFRSMKKVAVDLLKDEQQKISGGYDHAWLLDKRCADLGVPAASLRAGDGLLAMDLFTSMPALQFYSGNHVGGTPSRDGGVYESFQGLALEPGSLPDSPNHPEWDQPSCWLEPGDKYEHVVEYRFTAS
jgi:aldose 1-epimerase